MKHKIAIWLDNNDRPGNGLVLNLISTERNAPDRLTGFTRYKITVEIPDPKQPDDFAQPTMERV